jgi:flagellar biosynthetic protein FliO
MEWILVKTIFSLVAVLALMAGMVLILKKYVYNGRGASASSVNIEVLGYRMIGPKRSIHVLKVLSKIIVVGVTEGGMTALGEIDDEESLRQIGGQSVDQPKSANHFAEYMGRYFPSFSWNREKS